jgi:hypothetical protein
MNTLISKASERVNAITKKINIFVDNLKKQQLNFT